LQAHVVSFKKAKTFYCGHELMEQCKNPKPKMPKQRRRSISTH